MPEKRLPKTYKGYPAKELLVIWKQVQGKGITNGTPKEKIAAMSQLLREYRLSPESRY